MKKEILFAHFEKITVKRFSSICRNFASLEDAWHAEFDDFRKIKWDDELIHSFLTWRDSIDEKKLEANLEKNNIQCITKSDAEYPPLLKEIYDPPFCLFKKGKLKTSDSDLGVVGTRACTNYGKQMTIEIVSELARAGVHIVSGLALGIDGIAHKATIDSGGYTIAVLGGGIDDYTISPSSHRSLAREIVESGGCVLSEYPPGYQPTKFSFPRRNRIIAGLASAVLVVEAGERSGALITSQCALDCGRDVYTIPQNLTSKTSHGPSKLIKEGAALVTSANDILDSLDIHQLDLFEKSTELIPASSEEEKILAFLSREPMHIDELRRESKLEGKILSSTLTMMEMKGYARNVGNMMYIRGR